MTDHTTLCRFYDSVGQLLYVGITGNFDTADWMNNSHRYRWRDDDDRGDE